jgi:hypothetical protein
MKCQCPACGRSTRIAQDQFDFLVRCENCKTILLPRSAPTAKQGAAAEILEQQEPTIHIVPLGTLADHTNNKPRPHLDLLLTRPPGKPVKPKPPQFRLPDRAAKSQIHTNRGSVQAVLIAGMLFFSMLAVGAITFVLKKSSPQPARAESPPSHTTTPELAPRSPAQKAVPRTTTSTKTENPEATPTGSGELFADVPAQ